MNELKEKMEQIQFSENAEDNMLRAMRLAQAEGENKDKAETRVGRIIKLARMKKWTASFATIAILVGIFTNGHVQAAMLDAYHAFCINVLHNYETYYLENATEQNIACEQDGYKLELYKTAQGESTMAIEFNLYDADGNDVLDEGLVIMDANGEWLDGSTSAIKKGQHYLLVGESDKPFEEAITNLGIYYYNWRADGRYAETTAEFHIEIQAGNVLEEKSYALD